MGVLLFVLATALLIVAAILPRADSGMIVRRSEPVTAPTSWVEGIKLKLAQLAGRLRREPAPAPRAPQQQDLGGATDARPRRVRRRRPRRQSRAAATSTHPDPIAGLPAQVTVTAPEPALEEEPVGESTGSVPEVPLEETAQLEPIVVGASVGAVDEPVAGAETVADEALAEHDDEVALAALSDALAGSESGLGGTAEPQAAAEPVMEAEAEGEPQTGPQVAWWEAVTGALPAVPSESERIRIVSVLGTLGQPWCIEALRAALAAEEDVRVRNAIAAVLEHAGVA